MDKPIIRKNRELWDTVSTTNPKYTKKVKLGREFTAIDPYSQILEATNAFGPVGQGWGWEVSRVEYTPNDQLGILVKVWHGDRSQTYEQWGQAGLFRDKNKSSPDTDCFKKATTDGITKCLSYLGFNADVFLGKFDDNKYVQEMRDEYATENSKQNPAKLSSERSGMLSTYISSFDSCTEQSHIEKLIDDKFKKFIGDLRKENYLNQAAELENAYNLAIGRITKTNGEK
tara:strand:+ start:20455 stop:21141 length:687 start_codon:yes stop_codon:yes gene_type:complete